MGMTLLLIEDEVQNARIAMLLLQEEVDRVSWFKNYLIFIKHNVLNNVV